MPKPQHSFLPRAADNSSSEVKALCERLVPGGKFFYLDVEPIANMIENECYQNVALVIEKDGGSIQYGWQIWETLPGVMIEAEFHAVWIDPSGTLRNVSTSLPGSLQILFLPDPFRKYEGRQIDNVRMALKDDKVIREFIQNAESYFEVTNRGELANYHGYLKTTPEIRLLIEQRNQLIKEIVQKFYLKSV